MIVQEQCPWCPTVFDIDWAEPFALNPMFDHFKYGHGITLSFKG